MIVGGAAYIVSTAGVEENAVWATHFEGYHEVEIYRYIDAAMLEKVKAKDYWEDFQRALEDLNSDRWAKVKVDRALIALRDESEHALVLEGDVWMVEWSALQQEVEQLGQEVDHKENKHITDL